MIRFWKGEYSRFNKFKTDNSIFLSSYKNLNSALEAYYFLRRNYVCKNPYGEKMYDCDTDAKTNGDQLVAMLLALTRFRIYVKEKLVALS